MPLFAISCMFLSKNRFFSLSINLVRKTWRFFQKRLNFEFYKSKNPNKITDHDYFIRYKMRKLHKLILREFGRICLFYLWRGKFCSPPRITLGTVKWFLKISTMQVRRNYWFTAKITYFVRNSWFGKRCFLEFRKNYTVPHYRGQVKCAQPGKQFFWIGQGKILASYAESRNEKA